IDYHSHLALLAEVFEATGERMIGEARYVVASGDPVACEFAIAVADAWQGAGIARALLDRLERQAAACGIRRMMADTLVCNLPILAFEARAGYGVGVRGRGCE